MNNIAQKEIKAAMEEVLDERFKLPQNQHSEDHEWIKMQRLKHKRSVARWEKWKTSAGGAVIVGILGVIGLALTWVFNNFVNIIHFIGGNHGSN